MGDVLAIARTAACALAITGFAACGTTSKPVKPDPSYKLLTQPGTRAPADDLEKAILAQLKQLAPDKEANINGRVVVAGAPYAAASGRTCRAVSVRANGPAAARDHLACRIGNGWAFVPDVVRRPTTGGAK